MATTRDRRRPRRLLLVVAMAVAATVVPLGAARAAPSDLIFSEYVEGTNPNRALELYNGTGSPIDLTAGMYNVVLYLNGSLFPAPPIFLRGTVAPGGTFVLAHSEANLGMSPDQRDPGMRFSGNDLVVLRRGDVVLDSLGQYGVNPGDEWGTGLASTMDNTLRRKAWVEAGDTDLLDPYDPAAEWDGYPTDTFDGLGWHGGCADTTPPVVSVNVSPDMLWPPNHRHVTVNASVYVWDQDASPAVSLVSVTSSEPDDAAGGGDGHTSGDVVYVDATTFLLRAERAPAGGGRTYTVTYRAEDRCGNVATGSAAVLVPLA